MRELTLLDCTLRDGANVVGTGFNAELTKMIIEGLIASNIKRIEFGNALGLGAYGVTDTSSPLGDEEYMDLVQPYISQSDLGMFILAKNINETNVSLAAEKGLNFLRVGATAGDGKTAHEGIRLIKRYGLKCNYSIMKAYLLSPEELGEEAVMLESFGLDEITIMDSAGTMKPNQVREYVNVMTNKLQIPVGFHGHNNLGLSSANALEAVEAGATSIDVGLMGMARSAGNCSTEMIVALLQSENKLRHVDLLSLLEFINDRLEPEMKKYSFHNAISPLDLVYGISGCHSGFGRLYRCVAEEQGVSLHKLIIETSKIDRKAPTRDLMEEVARALS